MKKSYIDYRALAMDILHGQWLIQETPALRQAARDFLNKRAVNFGDSTDEGPKAVLCTMKGDSYGADTASENLPVQENLVLIVPIHGTLTKYDNCIGCSAMEVADTLEEFRDREDVCGFILDIDSPGYDRIMDVPHFPGGKARRYIVYIYACGSLDKTHFFSSQTSTTSAICEENLVPFLSRFKGNFRVLC